MIPLRASLLVTFLVLLFSGSLLADVVILKGNDLPLVGEVIRETDEGLIFRIKGLGRSSGFLIEENRIDRWWRDSYWVYTRQESERLETMRRLRAEKPSAVAYRREAPEKNAGRRPRSGGEIQEALVAKAMGRIKGVITENAFVRLGWIVVLYGVVTLLFFAGGKVVDLSALNLGQSAILAMITVFLAVGGSYYTYSTHIIYLRLYLLSLPRLK